MNTQTPTPAEEVIRKARRVRAANKVVKQSTALLFKPYQWQEELYAAGLDNRQRMLLAGNRTGKTMGAVFEVYCHATGNYPDWWVGHRFKFAPNIWCCGVSGEQIRDVLQRELFGDITAGGAFTGGMIPTKAIDSFIRAPVTPRLSKDVYVKHKTGSLSLISFKSYTQGPEPLMGSSVDFALVDEQPPDDAYAQILTRTMTGNKNQGGLLLVTCTPERGITEVLRQWLDDPLPGQFLSTVSWRDAHHLSEENKQQMLAAMPEHERRMRSEGLPVFGSGLVYKVATEEYVIDPFPIPRHWMVCAAIDFGITHPFACTWCAYNPDTDMLYVYDEYKIKDALPPMHVAAINSKGNGIPVVYPHDGSGREKGSGDTLATIYRNVGCNLVSLFTNPDGSQSVEPGILYIAQRLKVGTFKVFSTCFDTISEMRTYHRKEGKIVKKHDDLMDSMRYAAVSVTMYGTYMSDANVHTQGHNFEYETIDF